MACAKSSINSFSILVLTTYRAPGRLHHLPSQARLEVVLSQPVTVVRIASVPRAGDESWQFLRSSWRLPVACQSPINMDCRYLHPTANIVYQTIRASSNLPSSRHLEALRMVCKEAGTTITTRWWHRARLAQLTPGSVLARQALGSPYTRTRPSIATK